MRLAGRVECPFLASGALPVFLHDVIGINQEPCFGVTECRRALAKVTGQPLYRCQFQIVVVIGTATKIFVVCHISPPTGGFRGAPPTYEKTPPGVNRWGGSFL